MWNNFVFILTILFFSISDKALGQKITVQILYESLCPDSLQFINEQLYPVWNELAPHIDVHLVPFGKSASYNNGANFVCQHGPKECVGNRIQSCALSGINNQNAQVEYVHCFMNVFKKGLKNTEEFGQSCAANVGLEWSYIKECFESNSGTQLQLQAEEITVKVLPKFVPTIIFNGIFDQKIQDDSLIDFRSVACTFITQLHSDSCQQQTILRL